MALSEFKIYFLNHFIGLGRTQNRYFQIIPEIENLTWPRNLHCLLRDFLFFLKLTTSKFKRAAAEKFTSHVRELRHAFNAEDPLPLY